MTSKTRIEWIDLAKGFCMLLVILGHYPALTDAIHITQESLCLTYVRMPLYFMLSGLFFKTYGNFSYFLKKKINHLLIPYILFMGLHYLTPFSFDSVWFLYCLFVINIVGYLLIEITNKIPKLVHAPNKGVISIFNFLIISLLAWGGKFNVSSHIQYSILAEHFRWGESALIALPFFMGGYFLKNSTHYLYKESAIVIDLSLFIISVLSVLLIGWIYDWGWTSYHSKSFDIPFCIMYLIGFLGPLGILSISRLFKYVPLISYIGRYSIIVLITHKVVIQTLTLFQCFATNPFIVFIIIILVEVPIIYVCKTLFPYIFAQKELLK